jgi:hypothetical protein
MRFGLLKMVLSGALAMSLAACEKPPAPVVVVPPPPPAPPPPTRQPVTAVWNFHGGDVCTASAANSALALEVAASSSTLTMNARLGRGTPTPAGRSVTIAFSGSAGAWTVTGGKAASHRVMSSQPMNEDRAGQILVLLGGGVVRIGRPNEGLPPLEVPNGGTAGRDWFECVRRKLFP